MIFNFFPTKYLNSKQASKMDKSSNQSINNSTSSNSISSSNSNRKSFNRGRWLKEEDDKLKKLVHIYGDSNWSEISKFFQDRSDLQCQQRWDKVVNPELVKGPWTKEVNSIIITIF